MPRVLKYRTWCKKCKEWQLHSCNYICLECETEFTDIVHKDIPVEKLEEQRVRYARSEQRKLEQMIFGYVSMASGGFFNQVGEVKIIESDAGQKEINQQKMHESNRIYEIHKFYLSEKEKFKRLGRNDKCLCDSGKKYKKCCWEKFNSSFSIHHYPEHKIKLL